MAGESLACVVRATLDGQIASACSDGGVRQEVGTCSKGNEGQIALHAMVMHGDNNDGKIAPCATCKSPVHTARGMLGWCAQGV